MGGADDCHAYSSIDKAADHGVRLLPFVSEAQRETFEQLLCFATNQSVRGYDKRGKVSTLFKTGIEILMLFLAFMLRKDLVRVPRTIGLGVPVRDSDIDNSVGAASKKSLDEEVATITITLT
jgi:hypothetical protein